MKDQNNRDKPNLAASRLGLWECGECRDSHVSNNTLIIKQEL